MKRASELIEMRQKAKEEWEKEKNKFRTELLKNSIELCETIINPALEKEAINFKKESIKVNFKFVEGYNYTNNISVLYLTSFNETRNNTRYYKVLKDKSYDKIYIERYLQEHNLHINWSKSTDEGIEIFYRHSIDLTIKVKIK